MNAWRVLASLLLAVAIGARGQTATVAPTQPAVVTDPVLTAAGNLVGKALFLRGFYGANTLAFDAAGRLEGNGGAAADWTLCGANVLKAQRVGTDAVELDGVRAAIRYNPEAHEFQRHPLNDEKMRLTVRLAAGGPEAQVRELRVAFAAMFAVGIDPGLQHAAPPMWAHYFDPNLAWAADGLTGQPVYLLPGPQDVTAPLLAHRVDAQFPGAAAHDRVTGQVQLRAVVDPAGVPQRIVVVRPLGYGLDEAAAEAVAKWRFEPAMRGGKPVAAAITFNLDFQGPPAR